MAFDGLGKSNGSKDYKASYGVYFGPGSRYNKNGHLPADKTQTSHHAEIYAAIKAVQADRNVADIDDGDSNDSGCEDEKIDHIILMTDSSCVVDAMTKHMEMWEENGFRSTNGQVLKYKESLQELEGLVSEIENDGKELQLWLVPREENKGAARPVNEILDGALVPHLSQQSSFYYWTRMAHTNPTTRALASRLSVDLARGKRP